MRVTAAVLRQRNQPYSLEQLELAEPRPDEVLVRIAGAGMCHTDMLPRVPEIGLPLPIDRAERAALPGDVVKPILLLGD
jgi:aryl-alcohol dehydrogenase